MKKRKILFVASILAALSLYATSEKISINEFVQNINNTQESEKKVELMNTLKQRLAKLKGVELVNAKKIVKDNLVIKTIPSK